MDVLCALGTGLARVGSFTHQLSVFLFIFFIMYFLLFFFCSYALGLERWPPFGGCFGAHPRRGAGDGACAHRPFGRRVDGGRAEAAPREKRRPQKGETEVLFVVTEFLC